MTRSWFSKSLRLISGRAYTQGKGKLRSIRNEKAAKGETQNTSIAIA